VPRILDVTAEEVRAVAAQRLCPDNRAVLVYEPAEPADGDAATADEKNTAEETVQ